MTPPLLVSCNCGLPVERPHIKMLQYPSQSTDDIRRSRRLRPEAQEVEPDQDYEEPSPERKVQYSRAYEPRRYVAGAYRNYKIFAVSFIFCFIIVTSTQITAPPTPMKLRQGCPADLLHSRSLRAVQLACRHQPATVVAAFEGIQDAMNQCRERMRFQPWDCSNAGNIMHDPPLLKYGYRESALVWALSSAGAAWGVATACAQGWISECACTQNGQNSFEYEGCSFGVQHGITLSRKLLTKSSLSKNPLRHIEKHNLKAGRLAVKKTLIASCKCHGVSGSCQQKTCWKRTAKLDDITDYLISKYARATEFVEDQTSKHADLVYLEQSPDPCAKPATIPRVCAWRNETHSQGDCSKLCCGRGFSITHEVTRYKCDCRIVWCCNLVCKDCLQHRWVSTCN